MGFLQWLLGEEQPPKDKRQPADPSAKYLPQCAEFTAQLLETKRLPVVENPGINLRPKEFIVLYEKNVELVRTQTSRVGFGVGTRLGRIGGFPIYAGGWQTSPTEQIAVLGNGDLFITNQRILFLGGRTLSFDWDKVVRVSAISFQVAGATLHGMQVDSTKSQKPYIFDSLENPLLFAGIASLLSTSRPERPELTTQQIESIKVVQVEA